MIHQKFEIDRWKNIFALEKLRKEARELVEAWHRESPDAYKHVTIKKHVKLMSPSGEIVTSPTHLAVVEQLRDEYLTNRCLPTFPTDGFVFARGEPPNRCATKVGGLPFWPKKRDWPVGRTGAPMTFVAQFCFADSADLFDPLPGDILVLFADGAYHKDWHPQDVGALRFEWLNHSESNLVEETDIPPVRWDLFPVYGEIHRTVDYVTGGIWEKAWWSIMLKRSRGPREFFSGLFAENILEKDCHQSWNVTVIQGTKIGGLPPWIQNAEKFPGRFLCALGSIHPAYQTRAEDALSRPYPFTNHPAPLVRGVRRDSGGRRGVYRTEEEEIQRDRLLMWDDVGSLYLFLDSNGAINWTIQCY